MARGLGPPWGNLTGCLHPRYRHSGRTALASVTRTVRVASGARRLTVQVASHSRQSRLRDIRLAGHLYTPDDRAAGARPAIMVGQPDLCDKEEYVAPAVARLAEFYTANLTRPRQQAAPAA